MVNKLYLESAIQDIANAIREKNGKSDTYTVSQMGNAIRDISIGEECNHKIKEYAGTITETILGNRKYAVLAKDAVLAEHRNEENLTVVVAFDIEPTANTVRKVFAFNKTDMLYGEADHYQYTRRWGSTVNRSDSYLDIPVGDETIETLVGLVKITADGELRVYSNSANYAIRPSNYTVRVEW